MARSSEVGNGKNGRVLEQLVARSDAPRPVQCELGEVDDECIGAFKLSDLVNNWQMDEVQTLQSPSALVTRVRQSARASLATCWTICSGRDAARLRDRLLFEVHCRVVPMGG